ncbi:hypothetical protein JHK84_040244 [Glycine max]|nr:hypothetical protein JHK84_040244 [Glycine max]
MLNSLGLFNTVLGVQYSLRINISASNSITKLKFTIDTIIRKPKSSRKGSQSNTL